MKPLLGCLLLFGLFGWCCGVGQVPIQVVREQWPDEHGPDAARRVSEGVMAGQLLERTTAIYPPIAKAAGVSGAVVVRTLIGQDGLVERVMALTGPEMLRASAEEAVRHWTYKPYLLNGEAVRVDTTMTLNFELPGVRDGSGDPGKSGASAVRALSPLFCGSSKAGDAGYHQRVSSGVMQGLLLHRPDPIYPRVSVSGTVIMNVCVSADGVVEKVSVIAGPEALRETAVDAVKQWIYRPYLLSGEAVPVSTTTTINIDFGGTSQR